MLRRTIQSNIKNIIYPRGKVHNNYSKYVGWSCFSNIIISIESVLATHSMLSVIGQSSTELNISVNYIGKDIIGQLGGLYYMNKMGQKADIDSKKFINYSMCFQQCSIFMECMTPLLPIYTFIPVAGIANIGKNIAFTGIGNPYGFFNTLLVNNIKIIKQIIYPDHFQFTEKNYKILFQEAEKNNCNLITTEKDHVRIDDQFKKKIYYTKLSTTLIGKEILERELKKLF